MNIPHQVSYWEEVLRLTDHEMVASGACEAVEEQNEHVTIVVAAVFTFQSETESPKVILTSQGGLMKTERMKTARQTQSLPYGQVYMRFAQTSHCKYC